VREKNIKAFTSLRVGKRKKRRRTYNKALALVVVGSSNAFAMIM